MRDLTSIEVSIEELKAKNKDMRAVQFEQEKRVKIISGNLKELQLSKEQLEADYDMVK